MIDLNGKRALVTGAAGGIGRACVEMLLNAGARVVMTDRIEQPPAWAARHTGDRSAYMAADLRDAAAIERMIDDAAARWDGLDVLVNNAAIFAPQAPVHRTTLEEFDLMVSVNLRSVFLCCKHAYPHLLRSRGNIVNLSSMAGCTGEADHAVYSATKGAINALTKAMAIDYGPQGIRCNAVCPSSVLTPNTDAMVAQAADPGRVVEYRKSINHLRYTASPGEIASVVAFLACPGASFVTGAIVPVSGGSECGYGVK